MQIVGIAARHREFAKQRLSSLFYCKKNSFPPYIQN